MDRIRRVYLILMVGGTVGLLCACLPGDAPGRLALALPPLTFVLTGLIAFGYLASAGAAYVLNPAATLSLSFAIFFGVGGLLPAWGDDATLAWTQAQIDYTATEILLTHRVAAVCVIVISLVAMMTARGPVSTIRLGRNLTPSYLQKVLPRILTVGLVVRVFMELPFEYGAFNTSIPYSISQFAMLVTMSVVLIGFGIARGTLARKTYLPLFIALVAFQLVSSLLTFSKHDFFIQVLAAYAGFMLAKPTRGMVIAAAVSVVGGFIVVAPLVGVVRELSAVGEATTAAGRLAAVQTTATLVSDLKEEDQVPNIVWARLSFNHVAAFAIRERHDGRAGETVFRNGFWPLVPRFIWPSKPVMAKSGTDFNLIFIGNEDSFSGPAVPGELYWNGGYLGVILGAAYIGLLLGLFTTLSLRAVESFDVPGLYLIGMGLGAGWGLDDWFGGHYIGGLPIMLGAFVLLTLLAGKDSVDRPVTATQFA